jgi:hypothetical protein
MLPGARTRVWSDSENHRSQEHAQAATRVQGRPDGESVLGVRGCDVWTLSYGGGRAAGVSAPCWRHRRCSAAVPVRVCLACVLCARGALAGPGAEPRGPCVAVQAAGRLCVAAGTDSDVRDTGYKVKDKTRWRSAAVRVSILIVLLSQQAPDLSVPPVRAETRSVGPDRLM